MTYIKPPALKYTDIAIWIDENAYLNDCDESKLYEYLYHLVVMLAKKFNYFTKQDYYDDFGLYGASKLFMRLKDKKQFGENKKLPQIKSILNYLKTVIYPYKVDFMQEFFDQSVDSMEEILAETMDLGAIISRQVDIFDKVDFDTSLDSVHIILRSFVKSLPKDKHSSELNNIYLSCLLTLLNQIKYCKSLEITPETPLEEITEMYAKCKNAEPILYHLPLSMRDYIIVLIRKIKHLIAHELSIESMHNISVDSVFKSFMIDDNNEDE